MSYDSKLTFDQSLKWIVKSADWCKARGANLSCRNMDSALRALDAPIETTYGILKRHDISWYAVKAWLEGKREKPVPGERLRSLTGSGGEDSEREIPPEDCWKHLEQNHLDHMSRVESNRYQTIELDGGRPVGLVLIGDTHVGSQACDYPRLRWLADQLQREDIALYAVSIGDLLDSAIKPWALHEIAEQRSTIREQVNALAWWLDKCSGSLIAACAGNHDLWSAKLTGVSLLDHAIEKSRINLAYNPYQLVLTVKLGEIPYTFTLRHKARGTSIYAPAAGCLRWIRLNDSEYDSDAVVAGHIHQSGYACEPHHGRMRHAFQVGAYKLFEGDDYAVEHGFRPGNMSPEMLAVLHPDKRHIDGFQFIESGLLYLKALTEKRRGPKRGKRSRR